MLAPCWRRAGAVLGLCLNGEGGVVSRGAAGGRAHTCAGRAHSRPESACCSAALLELRSAHGVACSSSRSVGYGGSRGGVSALRQSPSWSSSSGSLRPAADGHFLEYLILDIARDDCSRIYWVQHTAFRDHDI